MAKRKLAEKPILTKITPYAKNAKKHPQAQLKQLAASLREFGWRQPVVVDKNNTIIVGHGRMLAYETFPEGIKEPWIVEAHDLTPTQAKAYRLADNKLNESDWDMVLAVEELKELDAAGFDIELTGFDRDLLIEADAKDDVVPENAPPVAKLGDLWALGEHRVLCGDSTDKASVERLMGDRKADMVFTDPPYGIEYEGGMKKWKMLKNDDNLDFLPGFVDQMVNACKKGGATYICFNDRNIPALMSVLTPRYELNKLLIWVKNNASFQISAHYKQRHEVILYLKQKGQKLNWHGDTRQDTIWEIKKPAKNEYHSTQKPVELVSKAVLNSSKEGDLIYDAFLGSGSTLIAAEKTGRICYGLELDPKYMDVIIKRWEDYTGLKAEEIL